MMRRDVRGHLIGLRDRLRDRRIGSRQRPVEWEFAMLKRVFGSGRVMVTTIERVRMKMVFSFIFF